MKTVHFIGIGGIGTSALAALYLHRGIKVSGSDNQLSPLTEQLQTKGAIIKKAHHASNIKNQDLVIYSPAIPLDNPELTEAQNQNIKTLSYPQALGLLSQEYFTIAITGTHGKSTTTAMTATILEKAKLDPTVIIGTKIPQFNNQNFRIGKSKYLIIEACEYKESFKHLKPKILAITNIEPEHLDHYKTPENYLQAFQNLKNNLSKQTHIIDTYPNYPHKLKIIGEHNKQNAGLSAKIAQHLQIPEQTIQTALKNFQGTWRRMEYLGKKNQTHFYDDYAHHPTEIKATLRALRDHYGSDQKILTIFQPHQYSRTITLLNDFAKSFTNTDKVIIPNIYRVRDSEEDLKKITPQKLVAEIGKKALYGKGLKQTETWLSQNYHNYNVVIIMGAGNVTELRKIITPTAT